MTRTGKLPQVLQGINAAIEEGFERIKINAVVMRGSNDDEVLDLVDFARDKGIDIAFIEEMPLGNIESHDRALTYCSSDDVREIIEQHYPLTHNPQKLLAHLVITACLTTKLGLVLFLRTVIISVVTVIVSESQ